MQEAMENTAEMANIIGSGFIGLAYYKYYSANIGHFFKNPKLFSNN